MRNLSFLKHAGVYALGDFLLMAGGFILLPLYTRCLSMREFGTLEVLERVGEIAGICLIARGVPLAVYAFYRQSESEEERRRVVGTAALVSAISVIVGALVLLPLSGSLGSFLQVESGLLLWTATLVALLDGFAVVAQAANQARIDSTWYVLVSCGQFVVRVVLSIVFVVGLGWGVWGIVAASLIRSVGFAGLLMGREWRRGMSWPNRKLLGDMLAFSLPFIPIGLVAFVLNSADRFFLVRCAGQEEVGVYGLGYRLATLVGLFSLTPLYRVWSARMHDVARQDDAPAVFGKVTSYLLAGYLFVGLGVCLLQDELIGWFAGPAFASAGVIVAPVVLAYWFQAMSVLMEAGFYVRRRTRDKLWVALASATVMLVLYVALIPPYAALGAAVATLIGFVVHAVLTCRVTQKFFPVRYEFGRLLCMAALAGLLWACSRFVGSGWAAVLVKVGLWALWPAAMWLFGVVSSDEKLVVRQCCLQLGRSCGIFRDPAEVPTEEAMSRPFAPAGPLGRHPEADVVHSRG